MKKALIYIGYAFTPAVPAILYLLAVKPALGTYALSVILGIAAYILICDQFLLASRPAFVVRTLGIKRLLGLHRTAPAVVFLLAIAHHQLKELNGFSEASLQARIGTAALATIALLILFSVLLMADTFLSRIGFLAAAKRWIYKTAGLNYKFSRTLHNIFAAASAVVVIHVLLASSSDLRQNPLGAAWMLAWMFLSLGAYIRYRASGRGTASPGAKTGQSQP